MLFFFILFLCSVIFAASANASVTIEGDSSPYNVSIGDTLSVTSRKSLQVGENFVKWEIVSGTGTFVDETEDSTGFIPSSDPVVIRRVTRNLPVTELSETFTKLYINQSSAIIPLYSFYGIRTYFESGEGGQYAILFTYQQSFSQLLFYEDSTFSDFTPPSTVSTPFNVGRDSRTTLDRSRYCYIRTQPHTKNYFFLYTTDYPNDNMKDSVFIRVARTYTLDVTHSGNGTAYVDSLGTGILSFGVQSYSRVIDTDTSRIYAVPGNDNVLDRWEVVSGSCSILDSDKDTTFVVGMKSDCKVRAVFRAGTVYPITGTPTQYNFKDHLYAKQASSGSAGVRFAFTAPSAGTYAIVVSNETTQDSAVYIRYTSTDFATAATTKKFLGTYSETMTLSAGQEVAIVVANTGNGANPFYINYATQAHKITLGTDGHGKALPVGGYATAYAGSRYSISAEANAGYRFSDWQTVSGTPVIDDKNAPYTYVTVSGDVELKARFKASSVYTLTGAKQKFNHQDNYYSESSRSAIRFTWTPPDSGSYMVSIEAVDPVGGIFTEYGTDKNFSTPVSEKIVSGTTSFTVHGTPGVPLYWTFQDSSSSIPNKSFNAWISSPYVLNVLSAKGGSAYPSGTVYAAPGNKTILTAWPHGGYKFKSWVNTEGDMTIDSPKESRTTVSLTDSVCSVKATFTNDESAEPVLNISKLDVGNYPEVCAQVSVTDKNTGNTFYGLVSDDFTLTQDGIPVTPQVTSIDNVTGVSVVIVVDESTSMTINDRMEKAKASIRSFVNDMGPYDRTSIVGFRGRDSTVVHQTMTSEKSLLTSAVDRLAPIGEVTNILTGAYVGVEQTVSETNPTAVIIFSDGDDNSGRMSVKEIVNFANTAKTSIYSIGLETDTKYPLRDIALNTGGSFTFANDASELAGIYASIRDNIMSQYMVCYQTPDTVQNGETHTVAISTKFNKITTSDTARWSENSLPPTVTLTEATKELIDNPQESNNPLTLGVYIRTLVGVSYADVYVRISGTNGVFTRYPLQNVRDSLWEFTVPASLVMAPGLDFYVIAADSLGQAGKSPRIQNPANQPYTIFVDNDIPAIEAVSVACEDSTSDLKTFRFSIKDSDGIDRATLYYKDSRAIIFQQMPLSYSGKNDTWVAEFSANVRDYDMLFYYLRVMDAKGASVRSPKEGTLVTDACRIHYVDDNDSSVTDPVPEDSILPPSPRDSIVYSLIADSAEMYDKDLDGRADYVRVHFKEERSDNITSVDSIFWNSNRGEWRYVPEGTIKQDRSDGTWFGGYINKPYRYGLTKADSAHPPFLAFSTIYSEELENVRLLDRVGAVPARATKSPGKIGLEEYMDPNSDMPPDTLVVTLSEPVINVGDEKGWEKLFRYSESCDDTVTHPLKLRHTPKIRENGQQWMLVLDDYSVKAGFCLSTDPSATYEDLAGNTMGRGGIRIEGKDGSLYLAEVRPLQAISGIGKTPKWIAPGGDEWESLPDSLAAISVKATMPYTAEVYIFDGIASYVTHFKQKFGYDGEMEQTIRGKPGDLFRQGYLHWNKRSDKGRKAGTGVYIWKIFFKFEDGHKETRIVKTGIYRRGSRKK